MVVELESHFVMKLVKMSQLTEVAVLLEGPSTSQKLSLWREAQVHSDGRSQQASLITRASHLLTCSYRLLLHCSTLIAQTDLAST